MKIQIGIILILLLAGHIQHAQAQVALRSSVVSNGGLPASKDGITLVGTLGQPIIGMSGNAQGTNQSSGFWHTSFEITTGVEQVESDQLPTAFRLEQNYPNPFNPTTTIAFSVPRASNVTLRLYDVFGRLITTLVDEDHRPGTYHVNFTANSLASGVYVYRIEAEGYEQTRKLTLLK